MSTTPAFRYEQCPENLHEAFIFEGMTAVMDYVDGTLYKNPGHGTGVTMNDWDEVEDKATSVWEEGKGIMEKYVEELQNLQLPELKSHKRKVEWSDTDGDEYDEERAAQGLPPWRKVVREETGSTNEVTILTDISAPYYIEAKDILYPGAAGLALTKIFEDKGYTVEFWVVCESENSFERCNFRTLNACRLKKCGEPLDITSIINQVAGWYFRSVYFTLLRTEAKKKDRELNPYLGQARAPHKDRIQWLTHDENRLVISGCFGRDEAADVVRAEVKRLQKKSGSDAK